MQPLLDYFCHQNTLKHFLKNFLKENEKLVKGYLTDVNKYLREREDSSASEDDRDRDSVTFVVGDEFPNGATTAAPIVQTSAPLIPLNSYVPMTTSVSTLRTTLSFPPQLVHQGNSFER